MTALSPSLLAADFSRLNDEMQKNHGILFVDRYAGHAAVGICGLGHQPGEAGVGLTGLFPDA